MNDTGKKDRPAVKADEVVTFHTEDYILSFSEVPCYPGQLSLTKIFSFSLVFQAAVPKVHSKV